MPCDRLETRGRPVLALPGGGEDRGGEGGRVGQAEEGWVGATSRRSEICYV
jgi:hypothetical protein